MTSPMHSPLQSPLQPVMRSPLEFRRRGGGFNIASTNPSAYYDRTNLATLFQDYAGTAPVTAVGQPIGVGLDQHIPNAPMTAGWAKTGGDGVVSIIGDVITITGATTTTDVAYKDLNEKVKRVVVNSEISNAVSPTIFVGGQPSTALEGTKTYSGFGGVYTLVRISSGSATFTILSQEQSDGNNQSQGTAGKLPLTAGNPIYADFDADDELITTFPASLGAGCTVCRSLPGTGASITTGVTIGTTYTDNVDAHALLIYTAAQWAALSAGDIANLTAWLNAKAGL